MNFDSTFEVLPPLEEVDNASKKIDSRNEKQHDKCLDDVEKDFLWNMLEASETSQHCRNGHLNL